MIGMNKDTEVVLLLCGRFDQSVDISPLFDHEYNAVAKCLRKSELRPADLRDCTHLPGVAAATKIEKSRLVTLLDRGPSLASAVEDWHAKGVWVVCPYDREHYPERLVMHLKGDAPPLLYGVGDRKLLKGGGLAFFGSEHVTPEDESFTKDIVEQCVRQKFPVVTGNEPRIGQLALSSALEAKGIVTLMLAGSLLKMSASSIFADALADQRLLLLSPNDPSARCTTKKILWKSKFLFALADFALVTNAREGKGPAWQGAIEELARANPRPVFVRTGPEMPPGNKSLCKRGALEFPNIKPSQHLRDSLDRTVRKAEAAKADEEEPVTDFADGFSILLTDGSTISLDDRGCLVEQGGARPVDALQVVRPIILQSLSYPRTCKELAKRLDVTYRQMTLWLRNLEKEERVTSDLSETCRTYFLKHNIQ